MAQNLQISQIDCFNQLKQTSHNHLRFLPTLKKIFLEVYPQLKFVNFHPIRFEFSLQTFLEPQNHFSKIFKLLELRVHNVGIRL